MDYKEKYEKALGWMREMYPCLTDSLREDAEHYFPELRESEEELIRNRLINLIRELASAKLPIMTGGYFVDGQDKKYIAYLEKQKEGEKEVSDLFDSTDSYNKGFRSGREKALQELKEHIKEDKTQCYAYDAGYAAGFIVGKEQGWKEHKAFVKESSKTADSIPSDCASDAKCEDRSPKHSDSDGIDIRDTPAYWRGWDDAMKQKEQKHPDGCFTCDEYKKGYEEGRRNGFTAGYNKAIKEVEQKEQKPDDDPLDDPKFLKGFDTGREVQRIFDEQKPVEGEFPYNTPADTVEGEIENIWSKLSCENKFTATKTGFREVILHFVNYVRSNAAPEWSEEDKKMIERLIRHTQKEFDELCNDRYGHQEIISDLKESCRERMRWLENRLKSLRPSWKPTEEQMNAIDRCVDYLEESDNEDAEIMESLQEQLHKLM